MFDDEPAQNKRDRKPGGRAPAQTMRSLIPFFAIAFGLGWGLLAVLIIFTAQIEAVFGPVSGTNPRFILAVYSPAIAGGTPQSAWSFGPCWIGVLALGVLVTPMFNASRGSILIPMLSHFQMNNPLWPEAQPWENYLFLIAAIAIVIIARRSMLHRDGAVTDILMPRPTSAPAPMFPPQDTGRLPRPPVVTRSLGSR